MASRNETGIDLEHLTSLAKRCAEREMLDEAEELFLLALRFDPDNLGVQLNLAQIRKQQKETLGRKRRDGEERLREQFRRNAIDAAHFFGLAALYEERHKRDQALECLEIARRKEVANPYIPKLSGKILFARRQYDEAAEELRRAIRFNPFDRETADLLSRAELELERYDVSLESAIDAFLLLQDGDRDNSDRIKKHIRQLKHLLSLSSEDMVRRFRDRREKLQTAFDRLEWQRERFLEAETESTTVAVATAAPPVVKRSGRIELSARLRRLDAWSTLGDEEVFRLTAAAREEVFRKGTRIFEYGSKSADIYLLEKGRIHIRRPTSYGTYELGSIHAGVLFGEVNFVSQYERSGEALVVEDSHVIRFDAPVLERLTEDEPAFGLQIYRSFWHGLAAKLRGANEQLRTFFSEAGTPNELHDLRRKARADAGLVEVKSTDKIQLLREQGLSGAELETLANFSDAKRYPSGTYLFHEGDAGDEMYVVLEGRVMISKFIPGGGEEALAILARGDFFGEMALIDGQPRSADAKAFEGPVTLVAFNRQTLKEIMEMEPRAARDFMKLLCRLISKRLREIDEKVTSWRIMSGARPLDDGFVEELTLHSAAS